MPTRLFLIALGTCLLALGACDQKPTGPRTPTPTVLQPALTEAAATAGPVASPSVPSAESVFPPASAAAAAAPMQERSNRTMSAAQESTAMPMPGQNNDHSAPLGTAKRASAP